jgi:hypothetical protein
MAIRNTRLIIKNNTVPSAPFSGATLYKGEAIVNTADGIMMFSGVTSSTSNWTPAGVGGNANFFEVGSNLYDLKIRNQIKAYNGVTNLSGKFLSGTTSGFVLADISSISGTSGSDTYVTGFTYNNSNVFTIGQNNGQPNLTALFNTVSGLTVNGTLSATTTNIGTENVNTLNATGATITTLNSTTINGGNVNVNNLTVTGSATYNQTATGATEIVNYSTLTAYSQTNDVYVTGGTVSYTGPNGSIVLGRKNASNVTITGLTDVFVTGGTYNAGTLTLNNNNNASFNVTGLTSTDTFVTGFTYSPTTNTFTIKQNQGQSDLPVQFTTVSGLTVSNLTPGRVVYVGTGGLLSDDTGFTYDAATNTFSVPTDGTVNVGTGGLNVAGSAVIQGSLTVFGPSVSAFTSQLYVEDDNITLNYNPTGSTTVTSIGAGWTIQDGSGIANTATTLSIGSSYLNGNLSPNTEYTASTGNENRNLFSQVGDIIIRNTNYSSSAPNGVRVLTENDILDGGSY